ncbi:chemotaxis protein MotA [Hydrogenoanaerobacterium saccharovorans]|uniref:Chemotaxis protein MotA n=1 Tax=Hydrogenoanaerobacterium saccharovorans TaxID=474960 RepID=A0A1H7ZVS4_9FIRM|nr:motility protein A [Hydrogenoanaerobacterium saccharovorans]RPF48396.1 chemotaxis protein MotA [Hydrogenoanaerobacterium saccharovorans]SEM61609.1 chemotaxis protein MotA [Hydrogenoanaerobacterium saccharovorans]
MDLMSILGLILSLGLVVFGMVFDQDTMTVVWGNLSAFIDYPSMAITFGGTIAVMMMSFPINSFTKIGKHLKIIFFPTKYNPVHFIEQIVEFAKEARMKGLLSLEDKLNETDDVFLRNSLMLVVDSVEPEKVKNLLESELAYLDDRHAQDRAFYEKGAAYAPAFGMIGTLIGLVLMLGSLSDVSKVGSGMAVALITTFYGSMLSNVIFLPISNKLKVRHEEEYLCKMIIVEGVQAIQAGENPKFIKEKLVQFLPAAALKKNTELSGAQNDDSAEQSAKGKRGRRK